MDIGKSFKAAMIPLVIFVVLNAVAIVLGTFVPAVACVTGIPVLIINAVIVGWAGFKAAKEEGLDIVGAALSGLIVGTVGAIVNGIVGLVVGVVSSLSMISATIGYILVGAIVGMVIWIVVGIVGGAILGAIGFLVADNMKGSPPAPKQAKK
jgi:hypothetical protein